MNEMEAALRDREAELARVQEVGRIGGVTIDVAGGLTGRRSPEYLRLHGLQTDAGQETHADWLARVHPEDRDRADGVLREALAGVATIYESEYRIVRPDDGRIRWIRARADIERDGDGRALRLIGAHIDFTEQKELELALRRSEERQTFLLRLSDALRLLDDPLEVQAAAARLLGEHLGVDGVAYGEVEPDGETMRVRRDWAREGRPSAIGEYRIEDFGPFLADLLRQGRIAAVEDAAADPHVPRDLFERTWSRIGVRSACAYPLIKQERLTVAIFLHHSAARPWSESDLTLVAEVGERTWSEVARARAEAHERLLNTELQHRVRNTLAVIRSIMRRTAENSDGLKTFQQHFEGRLAAFARTQSYVTREPESGMDFESALRDELLAHQIHDGGRVRIGGPNVRLKSKTAETLALAIHELVTNAVKYGALGVSDGRLEVRWSLPEGGRLRIEWREQVPGGIGAAPRRAGFGSELLERTLAYELDAKVALEFAPEGVRCAIDLPLAERR